MVTMELTLDNPCALDGYASMQTYDTAAADCEISWDQMFGCIPCYLTWISFLGAAVAAAIAYISANAVTGGIGGNIATLALVSSGLTLASITGMLVLACRSCFVTKCIAALAGALWEAMKNVVTSIYWSCANPDPYAELSCITTIGEEGAEY